MILMNIEKYEMDIIVYNIQDINVQNLCREKRIDWFFYNDMFVLLYKYSNVITKHEFLNDE